MLTKDNITRFINKQKNSRINVAKEQLNELLLVCMDKSPECQALYRKFRLSILELKDMVDDIDLYVGVNYFCQNPNFSILFDKQGFIAGYVFSKKDFLEEQEKIKALYQRILGIEQEYNDLIDKCRKFRTPQKAVQYLQKNGFDTSSLQNITKEGE
ncbi:hypothetical protein [Phascolarctobacterium succinatutens]|uniref:hypothetical protein n=1 Tax=Phascolarctobacterium succinatutens TaxID=626940 RepID=UPI00307E7F4A